MSQMSWRVHVGVGTYVQVQVQVKLSNNEIKYKKVTKRVHVRATLMMKPQPENR